jgi:hypothetical protein
VIRGVAPGKDGPVIILGLTEENLIRLRDDQPINVNLGSLLKEYVGASDPDEQTGTLSLAIIYGITHRAIVDTFEKAGIELPPNAAEQADAIDASLRGDSRL